MLTNVLLDTSKTTSLVGVSSAHAAAINVKTPNTVALIVEPTPSSTQVINAMNQSMRTHLLSSTLTGNPLPLLTLMLDSTTVSLQVLELVQLETSSLAKIKHLMSVG